MSYYKLLGVDKEPFSTSPDPDFFYPTREHESALTNILIELRLRRGLSVVLGDVGTGKTSLSRKLIRCLKERGDFILHMVLDPCYDSEHLFLTSLVRNFGIHTEGHGPEDGRLHSLTVLDLKEALERFLYQKCIVEGKTVVLIIDEAQKLTEAAMEMLRVILNYETNESKLLQLILLGQLELHSKIMNLANFFDRISFKFVLNPLGYQDTRDMIHFRLKQAGYQGRSPLFLDSAIRLIHQISGGYPRKITLLCHRALKHLVMKSQGAVDQALVREIIEEDIHAGWLNPILR
ncbi:MAG: AAA family ATPase [Candidatus Omnitrophica bacterium]|nr:AAA family ATPase [Candidatus Omnitrophota bacterium]